MAAAPSSTGTSASAATGGASAAAGGAGKAAASPQLPFFVYGTLMPGYANHDNFVRGRHTSATPAVLEGARLTHLGSFPGIRRISASETEALRAAGRPLPAVRGQLLGAPADAAVYAALLADLDGLEAYKEGSSDNMYDRIRVVVRVVRPDGTEAAVEAWGYEYLLTTDHASYVAVDDGDWHAFMVAHHLTAGAEAWADTIADKSKP